MFTHIVGRSANSNSLNVNAQQQVQGDVEVAISQVIAPSAADFEILVAVDVSQLKAIVLVASNNCTVETNNSGTPTNTINLLAGKPYIWSTGDYNTCLITADVSKIFLTNGVAAETTFQMLALSDL